LVAGAITYSLASAIGLVLAFFLDGNQDEAAGQR
jgi:hypothetical protein